MKALLLRSLGWEVTRLSGEVLSAASSEAAGVAAVRRSLAKASLSSADSSEASPVHVAFFKGRVGESSLQNVEIHSSELPKNRARRAWQRF